MSSDKNGRDEKNIKNTCNGERNISYQRRYDWFCFLCFVDVSNIPISALFFVVDIKLFDVFFFIYFGDLLAYFWEVYFILR